MYEHIDEPVDVLVAFLRNKTMPLSFNWHNKKYSVDRVDLIHSSYRGQEKFYYFSVTSAGNFFKLAFNTGNNKWRLEELYYGS